jgi:hypothetical protein
MFQLISLRTETEHDMMFTVLQMLQVHSTVRAQFAELYSMNVYL